MQNLLDVLIRNTEIELGRKLYTNEIDFLRWVYGRHVEEQRLKGKKPLYY